MEEDAQVQRVNLILSQMQSAISGRFSVIDVARACGVMLAECIGMATDDPKKAHAAAIETGKDIAKKIEEEWGRLQATRRALIETGRGVQ